MLFSFSCEERERERDNLLSSWSCAEEFDELVLVHVKKLFEVDASERELSECSSLWCSVRHLGCFLTSSFSSTLSCAPRRSLSLFFFFSLLLLLLLLLSFFLSFFLSLFLISSVFLHDKVAAAACRVEFYSSRNFTSSNMKYSKLKFQNRNPFKRRRRKKKEEERRNGEETARRERERGREKEREREREERRREREERRGVTPLPPPPPASLLFPERDSLSSFFFCVLCLSFGF